MTICTTCKLDKLNSEFFIRRRAKSGLTSSCKQCTLEQNRRSYQNTKYRTIEQRKRRCYNNIILRREYVNKIKHDKGCMFCQEVEPCCLDFHHINPDNKYQSISSLISKHATISKINIEISKCVILCANCHRKVHAGLLTITPDTI